jgi:hypothetical protein
MTIMWPICRYCNECKKPTTIMGPICGYCIECKKPTTITGPICGYYNECKKPITIMGPICMYCIFENGFMEFIIEIDVSIICLKCVSCFKNL